MPTEFDNAISKVANNLKRPLSFIPQEVKQKCEEIRLREGLPVCLTVGGSVLFVRQNSTVCDVFPQNALTATSDDIQQSLSLLCNKSVYLHESEIKQGFISLPHGCRAGVCGVFNADGMLVRVTSINIRIAQQIFDCARTLLPYASGGLLIAGPPSSGKTTMLRDLIRLLSNGASGRCLRVTVIDSRGEISGRGTLDLGVNTDVLYTLDKAVGTDIALRTMYPQFIAFDEIGTAAELKSVKNCFNAGVGIITTAHCRDIHDIMRRDVTREILESGAVSNVALLSEKRGTTPEILACEELKIGVCN